MKIIFLFGIMLLSFMAMEAISWLTHKYIMHGPLWFLHRDHHRRNDGQHIEKNDSIYFFFATVATVLFLFGIQEGWRDYRIWISFGITLYGATYFLVHDIFIHQRFNLLRTTQYTYFKALRRVHKLHHKCIGKEGASYFGMLFVPYKFLKNGSLPSK